MISIIAVNYNTLPWLELLVKSVRKFTAYTHEIIIFDNNSSDGSRTWLEKQRDVRATLFETNIKHGPALDFALHAARYPYCLVLDIDAHLQRSGWEEDLLTLYKSAPDIRLVAAKGTENPDQLGAKPIHACFQFFERQFFLDNSLSFIARDGHDVGRKNYYDIKALGFEVVRIGAGYEPNGEKFYSGAYGDEYYIDGKPTAYHQWYSARFWQKEQVDNYKAEDFNRMKSLLFDQPLVKEILAYD